MKKDEEKYKCDVCGIILISNKMPSNWKYLKTVKKHLCCKCSKSLPLLVDWGNADSKKLNKGNRFLWDSIKKTQKEYLEFIEMIARNDKDIDESMKKKTNRQCAMYIKRKLCTKFQLIRNVCDHCPLIMINCGYYMEKHIDERTSPIGAAKEIFKELGLDVRTKILEDLGLEEDK